MSPSRGFTMVELIVVMVVMGILAAVAAPRLVDRSALQDRGFRDQLQGVLRDARRIAVTQQRDVCVQLVAGSPQQAAVRYGAACNGVPVAEPGNTQPYVVPLPSGLVWGGVTQVIFNAQGQPVPNADQNLNVGVGVIRVVRETGYVYQP